MTVRVKTRATMVSYRATVLTRTQQALYDATELVTRHAAREAERLTAAKLYPPASKDGQPPAMRTGDLSRSIERSVVIELRGDNNPVGIFGSTTGYGRWLEFGTTDMAARPFLRPALSATVKNVQPLLRKAFKTAYRVSGQTFGTPVTLVED